MSTEEHVTKEKFLNIATQIYQRSGTTECGTLILALWNDVDELKNWIEGKVKGVRIIKTKAELMPAFKEFKDTDKVVLIALGTSKLEDNSDLEIIYYVTLKKP